MKLARVYRMEREKGKPGHCGARQWKSWKQVSGHKYAAWKPGEFHPRATYLQRLRHLTNTRK